MVAKVIPFSRCSQCDEDEGRDFEAWEEYVELYERGDFAGLVRLCEATLRRWPDDVNAQYDLGDAYVRNGQPERAIEFLTPLHRADPEQTAYQHGILDALFALGRTEQDFAWLRAPRVYRVGPCPARRLLPLSAPQTSAASRARAGRRGAGRGVPGLFGG